MDSSLASIIEEYLSGSVTLEELEEWYIPRLPIIHKQGVDSLEVRLLGEIELSLIEINADRMTEKKLRTNLEKILLSFRGVVIKHCIYAEDVSPFTVESIENPHILIPPQEINSNAHLDFTKDAACNEVIEIT